MNCPICSSNDSKKKFILSDDRYGCPGEFQQWECFQCGHHYLEHDLKDSDLEGLYTKYYPRRLLDENYKPFMAEAKGFNSWLNGEKRAFAAVPKEVRVLDIGCGACETLAYHTARGCEAWGVETDHNVKRIAEKYGYKLISGVFSPEQVPNSYFDFVTMDQVIEHVIDPHKTMHDIKKVLKPQGRFAFTTPNAKSWGAGIFGKKWINWHAPYHLHAFSLASITKLAQDTGFKVIDYKWITHSSWVYYQAIHSLAYPEAGKPSNFWTHNWDELQKNKKFSKFKPIIDKLERKKANHILTRTFDTLGAGDNFYVVLEKAQ